MWRNSVVRQVYIPRDGEAVEVHGNISLYEVAGQYQLYADLIRPAGEGILFKEFLRLKARLEDEGLFDPARKREIPKFPRVIGIVTSPTGAALRDMLNTLRRRCPMVQVVLAPTSVQGDDAPEGICKALERLNSRVHPDVILVARGGGSIEDLWAFNDERVARAISSSPSPVISGVGHETDFTIADFVADLRAPTPTAAAEIASPNRAELQADLDDVVERMGRAAQAVLSSCRWQLQTIQNRLMLRSPRSKIRSDLQSLDALDHRMATLMAHNIRLQRTRLDGLAQRLLVLNPLAVLRRGFAVVTDEKGNLVRKLDQVASGMRLSVRVEDGQFPVRVENQPAANGEEHAG
jgi:exodeoxyribonuclease VII large subunit